MNEIPNRIAESDTEKLSAHTLFVATLHLAHENNYVLAPVGEKCDFEINNIDSEPA
jgi:hypothetical protein